MARLMLQMMGAFAEFERALLRERHMEGIAIAKAKGKYLGRKTALGPEESRKARELAAEGVPKARIARRLGGSRTTIYKALAGEQ